MKRSPKSRKKKKKIGIPLILRQVSRGSVSPSPAAATGRVRGAAAQRWRMLRSIYPRGKRDWSPSRRRPWLGYGWWGPVSPSPPRTRGAAGIAVRMAKQGSSALAAIPGSRDAASEPYPAPSPKPQDSHPTPRPTAPTRPARTGVGSPQKAATCLPEIH